MQHEPCEISQLKEIEIKKIKDNIIEEKALDLMSSLFKVISDPTRIKILYAIEHQALCVCDISLLLNMTQSAISHQLRILRQEGLVSYQKRGKHVFYTLKDEHVHLIFNQAFVHVMEG
ncbi:MAG: transcriptional regulator [Tenericutes bacterium HGW-Tenericutes-6]|nr:MAG: transcriptional regulator [Tenericutes bacterium HGW-Tenericutes-6]